MANLLFSPSELLQEIDALQSLAAKFLDRSSPFQLAELSSDIQGLQSSEGPLLLMIPKDRPLRTRVSAGEFEPSNKSSSRRVYGTITGIWKIEARLHKVRDPDRPAKKVKPKMLIGFTGLASTVFTVVEETTNDVVARWKVEFGDTIAPGCFFHTFASADEAFPVPRHPNVFSSPMSAIEFAISELFQDSWEESVSGATDAPQRWRSIQKKRLEALLNWQLELIKETTSSPWCSLKIAKPYEALFL